MNFSPVEYKNQEELDYIIHNNSKHWSILWFVCNAGDGKYFDTCSVFY